MRDANQLAQKMKAALEAKGFDFLVETETNQNFPILSNGLIAKLKKQYEFHVWQEMDNDYSAIRLVTSWATTESVVDEFVA